MTYKISEDRHTLTLIADNNTRRNLKTIRDDECNPDWGGCLMESEILETMLANSDLDWVNPFYTGDLTDAPTLGITGEEVSSLSEFPEALGFIPTSCDTCVPVLERWGYAHYQTRSFLDDLVEQGSAEFVDQF